MSLGGGEGATARPSRAVPSLGSKPAWLEAYSSPLDKEPKLAAEYRIDAVLIFQQKNCVIALM